MLISNASKVILKILQARLQEYVNQDIPDVQAGFRKSRGTRDQIANIHWMGFPHSSVGKESTCNAGDPSSIPGSGRSAGKGTGYPLQYSWTSLVGSAGKESAHNTGDLSSIPGLETSPREEKGYPLQNI